MNSENSLEKKSFRVLSLPLVSLIRAASEESKNIFIYATRKGLSPITVCSDCGEEVLCENCNSPVVLYKAPKTNVFRCHQCGGTRSAKELCKKCGSWRLMPLGVGIERVVDEIRELTENEILPRINMETNVFQINKDVTSANEAAQIAEKFHKTPGSILIGTEMALYYLKNTTDFTAVASIDSLFSVPDFRIREKIFHLILSIKLFAREKCLVQVRKAEKTVIELALSGNILDFYKMEIEDRKFLEYPPFSVFIKIIVRGQKVFVEKETRFLEKFFERWNPVIFNSLSERRDNPMAANCVIKIQRNDWPNNELLSKILSLPPYFEIKVDPDNLL